MRPQNDDDDPWDTPDPALTLATRQQDWYAQHRNRSRIAHMATEILLLLSAAATTLAAALQASAWGTATLAAISLVLTGSRRIFDWHENWIAFGSAWAELRTAIHEHMLRDDRLSQAAQRKLVNAVNDIVTAETSRWATRRRTVSGDQKNS
ncbi:DUF4231 domain-containing protein [Actinocrispum sp. NPDC049592]|uniref:DUF4231 domain-containing protein n=1 Tax=Actinocrispum sp. NPDC049592 TaxID=3154835 RepID=UPI003445AF1F